jgi:hypothetical protein
MTLTPKEDMAAARLAKLVQDLDARMAEIVDALLELSGAAHRDAVIDRVARRRTGQPASPGLKTELIAAFDAHRRALEARGLAPLVHQPFGARSHRWALTPEADDFLRRANL